MAPRRTLTKSRFVLATECPTKLFYTGKAQYANRKKVDPFLQALAEGGFQVGELAKAYYSEGIDLTSVGADEAVAVTDSHLSKDKVTLFEACLLHGSMLCRVDILIKNGDLFELIEVKAKSYDSDKDRDFLTEKGGVHGKWRSYLYDLAFQAEVLQRLFPAATIRPSLLLANKRAMCPTDGLNQKFLLRPGHDGRTRAIRTTELTEQELSHRVLCKVSATQALAVITKELLDCGEQSLPFAEAIEYFSAKYAADELIVSGLGSKCAGCEFRRGEGDPPEIRDGQQECWQRVLGSDYVPERPTVLEIWNYRAKDKLLAAGTYYMADVRLADFEVPESDGTGLENTARQYLQIRKVQEGDDSIYIHREGLQREISALRYPLHFIDFETTMVAIPFNKGRAPYEGIAFQFSHHRLDLNGTLTHVGEYLNTRSGYFPNYDFIRVLQSQLSDDCGSIFRYAAHENTFLNLIYEQLCVDPEPPEDAETLKAFLREISKSKRDSTEQWDGSRAMIDLLRWVHRYYYDPATRGRNSLKYILPSVLKHSGYLQERYSTNAYGRGEKLRGTNFSNHLWVQRSGGVITDPYRLLPKLFAELSDTEFARLTHDDDLRNGAAALTAYARMQFSEMDPQERQALTEGLLRYCELDTLAMVMVFEAFREWAHEES